MKASKAVDRRVQRTHRMLRDALVGLILERGWDAISVQDVCERADVGRSTFYVHFADKEDLLVGGLDMLGQFLRAQLPASAASRPLAFARGMIDHAHEQRRLFLAIVGKRSGHVVQQRFRQLLIELVAEDLAALAPVGPRREATVHYVAGAFFELLIWWLETKNQLKASDVEEHFHHLTTPVLAVLQKAKPGAV